MLVLCLCVCCMVADSLLWKREATRETGTGAYKDSGDGGYGTLLDIAETMSLKGLGRPPEMTSGPTGRSRCVCTSVSRVYEKERNH